MTNFSTAQGRHHQTRITVIDGINVIPRQLDKHIDYNIRPAARCKRQKFGLADGDGADWRWLDALFSCVWSEQIGIFNTAQLENDTFVPNSADHITVSGGGPSGLILDEARGKPPA